jgi:hypothetical protein
MGSLRDRFAEIDQERAERDKAIRDKFAGKRANLHGTMEDRIPWDVFRMGQKAGFTLDHGQEGALMIKGDGREIQAAGACAEIVPDSARRVGLHREFLVKVTAANGSVLVGSAKNKHRATVIRFAQWLNEGTP